MWFLKDKREQKEIEHLRQLLVRTDERPLMIAVMVLQAACMLLLAFKGGSVEGFSLLMAALLPLGTYFGMKLLTHFWPVDRAMVLLTAFLCALSVITLRAVFLDPDKARQQAIYLLPAFGALMIGIVTARILTGREAVIKLAMPLCLALMALPLGFTTASSAKSWINLGFIQFQPSELIKPAAVVIFASGFTREKRLKGWIGTMIYAGLLCAILFLQRDLGAMLLYFLLTLAMFTVGTGKWRFTLLIVLAAFILFMTTIPAAMASWFPRNVPAWAPLSHMSSDLL